LADDSYDAAAAPVVSNPTAGILAVAHSRLIWRVQTPVDKGQNQEEGASQPSGTILVGSPSSLRPSGGAFV